MQAQHGQAALAKGASTDRSATISLIAGLAWIGAALCYGYLAFLQLQYAPLVAGQADQLRGLALVNGIGAAITLFLGARLILGTSAATLTGSAVWGGLGVAYGAYQISQGLTHEVFLLGTLFTGAAGILSLVAALGTAKADGGGPLLSPVAKGILILMGAAVLLGGIGLLMNR